MNDGSKEKRHVLRQWWLALPHGPMTGGALFCVLGGVLSGAAGGSPYLSLMTVRFSSLLPPVTPVRTVWLVWYAVLGMELGRLLAFRGDHATAEKYLRTAVPYISMLYIGYLWYPVFFGKGWLCISLLICFTVLVLCGLAIRHAVTVSRRTTFLLFLHGLWLLWLTCGSVRLLFSR